MINLFFSGGPEGRAASCQTPIGGSNSALRVAAKKEESSVEDKCQSHFNN